MNKRKKFNISEDINRGITDVMNAVNSDAGSFRYEVVALSRIEVDPDNPRELALSAKDIAEGIKSEDTNFLKKKAEKDELERLSLTIKSKGVINPVVVYKFGTNYRLVAGERRYLASLMVGKDNIHARILGKKPDLLNLRSLQWIENNEREDLSLKEKLNNLKSIIDAHLDSSSDSNTDTKLSIALLRQLFGFTNTQAGYYFSVMNAPVDLKASVDKGDVKSLDKAAFIASIKENDIRKVVLQACIDGESLKSLRKIAHQEKQQARKAKKRANGLLTQIQQRKGRPASQVNLGKVKDIKIVRKLIEAVVSNPIYVRYATQFAKADWNSYDQATKRFQELLKIIAKENS